MSREPASPETNIPAPPEHPDDLRAWADQFHVAARLDDVIIGQGGQIGHAGHDTGVGHADDDGAAGEAGVALVFDELFSSKRVTISSALPSSDRVGRMLMTFGTAPSGT